MPELFNGVIKFREEDFILHKDLFENLKDKQSPHTLFIGCSDSRVVPTLIIKSLPGELFIIRNIANIVPPYRETEEYVATTSAIEYAVQVLNVENIVVCGHSNCGGCRALYMEDEKLLKIPHVKKWLELAKRAKDKLLSNLQDDSLPEDKLEWMTEQANVIEQIKNLLTYPYIIDKYIEGKLKIYGWYYIIQTGEIYNYNKDNGYFELIK
ncbi:MAG TPA: carbonic anhydrase [Spirochaetota bacterium]|nr:carbonic anhydrase [Spirochaetota bacterium]HOL56690.1 carbonic anhydrase [Spirochaetota bacterium]HPP04563.1 carbonic anhydrase [Spirochaetota bacterium]